MDRALHRFTINDSSDLRAGGSHGLRAGSHGAGNIRGGPSQRRLDDKLAVRTHEYNDLWARGDWEEKQ